MIGIVSDTWAAKTIQRNLSRLGVPCIVVVPKPNVTFSDKLDGIIFIPKAISHGAQNRARAWGSRTGKPVICLAKNISLHDELLRAGITSLPSPETPMPDAMLLSPPSSPLYALREANYPSTGQWLKTLAEAYPGTLTLNAIEQHPDWPKEERIAQARVAYFNKIRSDWRIQNGLPPFRTAARGVSRKARRNLPINYVYRDDEPERWAALANKLTQEPQEKAQGQEQGIERVKERVAKRTAEIAAAHKKRVKAPLSSSLPEPMEEIRTAIEMLRNMLRQYRVERAEVTAWNGCTLSNTPRTVSEELTIFIESE
jgi:hypothetical protein